MPWGRSAPGPCWASPSARGAPGRRGPSGPLPLPLSGRAQAAASAVVYFPETGHYLQAGFLEHWRAPLGAGAPGPAGEARQQRDAGVGGMVQQSTGPPGRGKVRGSSRAQPLGHGGMVRALAVVGGGARVPCAPGVLD